MDEAEKCRRCGRVRQQGSKPGYCRACLIDFFTTNPPETEPSSEQDVTGLEFWRLDGGRFRLIRQLGEGGMGVIWLAEDSSLDGNRVALKLVKERLRANTILIRSLREELKLARKLASRCIVKVYDWHAPEEEPPFLSMEFVDGPTLAAVLAEHPRGIPYHRLHPLFLDLCEALGHAHQLRVLHRDIKPGNILLGREAVEPKNGKPGAPDREIAKLSDFGIGRLLDEQGAKGQGGGTTPYMSPAQALGEAATPGDDIFALGVTFYELLTGKLPYGEAGCREQALVPWVEAIDDPKQLEAIPLPVRQLITAALAVNPARRPDGAAVMHRTLAAHPPRRELVPPPPPPPPRESWATPRLQLLVMIALLVTGVAYWLNRKPGEKSPTTKSDPKPEVPVSSASVIVEYTPAEELANLTLTADSTLTPSKKTVVGSNGFVRFTGLEPGRYSLRVEATGYATNYVRTPDLQRGQTNTVASRLVRLTGGLRFSAGARGWKGPAPSYALKDAATGLAIRSGQMEGWKQDVQLLPTGTYELSVQLPGESVLKRTVRIDANVQTTEQFYFKMVKVNVTNFVAGGNKVVSASFVWADRNGRRTNTTPVSLDIYNGFRAFTVKAPGFHERSLEIDVEEESRNAMNIIMDLSPALHPLIDEPFTNLMGMAFLPLRRGASATAAAVWMGMTEVTVGQFQSFATRTGFDRRGLKGLTSHGPVDFSDRSWSNPGYATTRDHPVTGVSWRDANQFCDWLTETERKLNALTSSQSYRLQTARQWEEACTQRGADRGRNFAGSEWIIHPCWPELWRCLTASRASDGMHWPAAVGDSDRAKGGLGILNLADNVREWCREEYMPERNSAELRAAYPDSLGAFTYSEEYPWRMVCGGSWYDHEPLFWEPTSRLCALEVDRTDYLGFRVVIEEDSASLVAQ